MQENVPLNIETPANTRNRRLLQALVAGVTVIMVAALAIVIIGVLKSQPTNLSRSLRITQSSLKPTVESGKLMWTGTVVNDGKQELPAPWIKVTIYNPAGDSVDTGEATTDVASIPAGGSLVYTSQFDTRGFNLRQKAVLETPNSRGLGM